MAILPQLMLISLEGRENEMEVRVAVLMKH